MRAFVLGLAAAFTLAATAAQATPVTYTFSGFTNALVCTLCNGQDDVDYGKAFSLVFNGDTSLVDNTGSPYSRQYNMTGALSMTFYSATLTGIQIVANGAGFPFENIGFYNAAASNSLGYSDPSLAGYDLTQNFGPVTVDGSTPFPSFLNSTFNGGGFSATNGDTVYFSELSSLTFQAVVARVSDVPEPLTLSLFGAGVAGAVFARRRKAQA